MRVRAGKPIADQTAVCVDRNTRRAPMGELVSAVGNASACHGSMKNEGLSPGGLFFGHDDITNSANRLIGVLNAIISGNPHKETVGLLQ